MADVAVQHGAVHSSLCGSLIELRTPMAPPSVSDERRVHAESPDAFTRPSTSRRSRARR